MSISADICALRTSADKRVFMCTSSDKMFLYLLWLIKAFLCAPVLINAFCSLVPINVVLIGVLCALVLINAFFMRSTPDKMFLHALVLMKIFCALVPIDVFCALEPINAFYAH